MDCAANFTYKAVVENVCLGECKDKQDQFVYKVASSPLNYFTTVSPYALVRRRTPRYEPISSRYYHCHCRCMLLFIEWFIKIGIFSLMGSSEKKVFTTRTFAERFIFKTPPITACYLKKKKKKKNISLISISDAHCVRHDLFNEAVFPRWATVTAAATTTACVKMND